MALQNVMSETDPDAHLAKIAALVLKREASRLRLVERSPSCERLAPSQNQTSL